MSIPSIDNNIIGILENTMVRIYENDHYKYIPIQNIKKGSCVIINNLSVFVECIIKIKYTGPICFAQIDNYNIGITPYYPIFTTSNNFTFPIYSSLFDIDDVNDVYIYNIFLENNYNNNNYILLGGDIVAFTLNNEIEYQIISHNYFGTNRVLNDFSKHPDWNNGFIQLESIKIIIDDDNNIIGIDY